MDNVRLRDIYVGSETLVEERMNAVQLYLHTINYRIIDLHDAIKRAQPVADGTVCLELYRCGPFCTGCPHPRWVKYRWTQPTPTRPAQLFCINLDAKNINPAQAMAKSLPSRKVVLSLIREAKSLLAKRAALLKVLRAAGPFASEI